MQEPLLTPGARLLRGQRVEVPDLPSQDERLGPRLEEAHDALAYRDLLVPAEKVEEARGVHDVEAPLQRRQPAGLGGREDVARDEAHREAVPVAEELVAQLDELGAQVRAGQVGGRGAVERELPKDVPEAAADVQERLAALQAGDDVLVLGRLGDVEVQESPAADAWVVENGECPVTL